VGGALLLLLLLLLVVVVFLLMPSLLVMGEGGLLYSLFLLSPFLLSFYNHSLLSLSDRLNSTSLLPFLHFFP